MSLHLPSGLVYVLGEYFTTWSLPSLPVGTEPQSSPKVRAEGLLVFLFLENAPSPGHVHNPRHACGLSDFQKYVRPFCQLWTFYSQDFPLKLFDWPTVYLTWSCHLRQSCSTSFFGQKPEHTGRVWSQESQRQSFKSSLPVKPLAREWSLEQVLIQISPLVWLPGC